MPQLTNKKKILPEFGLSKRKMALSHLKVFVVFLLVLILLPSSVWLAPPPLIAPPLPLTPGSPLQESFMVHPTADNVPNVGEYKIKQLHFAEIELHFRSVRSASSSATRSTSRTCSWSTFSGRTFGRQTLFFLESRSP